MKIFGKNSLNRVAGLTGMILITALSGTQASADDRVHPINYGQIDYEHFDHGHFDHGHFEYVYKGKEGQKDCYLGIVEMGYDSVGPFVTVVTTLNHHGHGPGEITARPSSESHWVYEDEETTLVIARLMENESLWTPDSYFVSVWHGNHTDELTCEGLQLTELDEFRDGEGDEHDHDHHDH